MSEARSFINPQAQSYESLKAGTPMSANQRAKFDVLNAHIANGVVVGGELVIVGDPSTPLRSKRSMNPTFDKKSPPERALL